jgi:hypothetical protein
MGCRDKEKATLHQEPGKDEWRRIDVGRAHNAKMA